MSTKLMRTRPYLITKNLSEKKAESIIKLLSVAREMISDAPFHVHIDRAIRHIRDRVRYE